MKIVEQILLLHERATLKYPEEIAEIDKVIEDPTLSSTEYHTAYDTCRNLLNVFPKKVKQIQARMTKLRSLVRSSK